MNSVVKCDKCNKTYIIGGDTRIKRKKYSKGIEEVYHICPYCKERYTAYYMDSNIRRLRRDIRLRTNKYNKDVDKIVKSFKQANKEDDYETVLEDHLKIMNTLKEEFEKDMIELQMKMKNSMDQLKTKMELNLKR